MENKTIYRIKKWFFLCVLLILNLSLCIITYIFQEFFVITLLYIIFKSKDIISVIGIILHNLIKKLYNKKIVHHADKCKIVI